MSGWVMSYRAARRYRPGMQSSSGENTRYPFPISSARSSKYSLTDRCLSTASGGYPAQPPSLITMDWSQNSSPGQAAWTWQFPSPSSPSWWACYCWWVLLRYGGYFGGERCVDRLSHGLVFFIAIISHCRYHAGTCMCKIEIPPYISCHISN